MSFDSLMSAVQRLSASMDALAALGAELRVRREGLFAAPRVRQLLQEVVQCLEPNIVDGLTEDQEATALAIIEGSFRHAVDLLDKPARMPGWSYSDPAVLQGMGLRSKRFVPLIEMLASRQPEVREALGRPGTLLDVGTGVGWLAIEAAQSWPEWRVVGIDCWEAALNLARANVEASGMAGRIELRRQSIDYLEDDDAFTMAWLPGPFLPPAIVPAALERCRRALRPGGWLVFGLFQPPPEAFGPALNALKIVRDGGYPWTTGEIEQRLRRLGFTQIESYSLGPPMVQVAGRKPARLSTPPP
jgi:ubiquinone/menaquinone biosynthesis C-methylase UbiE